jgi:DnaJ domain
VNFDENPFEVLGVSVDATMDEITVAWREKVKNLHPDRFPDVSDEVTASLTRETARVNNAYTQIKSDPEGTRRMFTPGAPGGVGDQTWSNPDADHRRGRQQRRPSGPVCDLCASVNTRQFVFSRQIGLVIQRRSGIVEALLCRHCALSIGRDFQSRTLTTGWWGVTAFFVNIGYIARNSLGLWRASRMDQPAPPPGFVTFPLDPGRPVAMRAFSWVGPVVIAVWLMFGSLTDASPTNSSIPVSSTPRAATWAVSSCVSGFSQVVPVSCTKPNNGIIISKQTTASMCPRIATSYVIVGTWVYCIAGNP